MQFRLQLHSSACLVDVQCLYQSQISILQLVLEAKVRSRQTDRNDLVILTFELQHLKEATKQCYVLLASKLQFL